MMRVMMPVVVAVMMAGMGMIGMVVMAV